MAGELRARVGSEHARLRRVLVHTPGKERLGLQAPARAEPAPSALTQLAELQREHAGLKAALEDALGGEAVVELTGLLGQVFEGDARRRRVILAEMLGEEGAGAFVAGLETAGRSLGTIETGALVDALVHPSSPSLVWVRDPAMSTPAGFIVHEMAQAHRGREPGLLRAALRHHPMFAADSVLLDLTDRTGIHCGPDAPIDWNLLDGGNTLVIGEGALAVGVPGPGALADFALEAWVRRVLLADASPRIERIYLVRVPAVFGHLDAVFTPLAPGCALAMPYLFGGADPIARPDIRRGIRDYQGWSSGRGAADPRPGRLSARDFEGAGQVETFTRDPSRPGGIARQRGPRRFLDQLVEDGWLAPGQIAWIGGCREDHASAAGHLSAALQEQGQQAGNVLVLGPDEAVMNGDNPGTRRSIERALGRAGRTLRLRELALGAFAARYGGPRCLTLPLLRSDGATIR